MVLDFGGNSLFSPDGLYNDVGSLSERWGQDGSTPVSFSFTASADATIYTVPTGKILYITSISVVNATSGNFYLRDASAVGTIKYGVWGAASGVITVNLSAPLFFETSLYNDVVSGAMYCTVTGWIEDA